MKRVAQINKDKILRSIIDKCESLQESTLNEENLEVLLFCDNLMKRVAYDKDKRRNSS